MGILDVSRPDPGVPGFLYGMGEGTDAPDGPAGAATNSVEGMVAVLALGIAYFPVSHFPRVRGGRKRARILSVAGGIVFFGTGGLLFGLFGITLRLPELVVVGGVWGLMIVTRPQRSFEW